MTIAALPTNNEYEIWGKKMLSERAQIITLYWGLAFLAIFVFALIFLLNMVPPPPATLSPQEVADFYKEFGAEIKFGALIASWTSAFMVPFSVVAAIQMARLESGTPTWAILAFAGGILMSMFLVFPPMLWGVAAFTPDRAPEATALIHELATLSLVTTDQFYIFQMIPMTIVSLKIKKHDELSGWPRWLGFFTLWSALAFEVGALAFLFKTGPFAWDGILVFWMPAVLFTIWVVTASIWLIISIKRQEAAKLTA